MLEKVDEDVAISPRASTIVNTRRWRTIRMSARPSYHEYGSTRTGRFLEPTIDAQYDWYCRRIQKNG